MKYLLLILMSMNLAYAQEVKKDMPSSAAIEDFLSAYNNKISYAQKFKDECGDGSSQASTEKKCIEINRNFRSADTIVNGYLNKKDEKNAIKEMHREYFARAFSNDKIDVEKFIEDAQYALKNKKGTLGLRDQKKLSLFEKNLKDQNAHNQNQKTENLALEIADKEKRRLAYEKDKLEFEKAGVGTANVAEGNTTAGSDEGTAAIPTIPKTADQATNQIPGQILISPPKVQLLKLDNVKLGKTNPEKTDTSILSDYKKSHPSAKPGVTLETIQNRDVAAKKPGLNAPKDTAKNIQATAEVVVSENKVFEENKKDEVVDNKETAVKKEEIEGLKKLIHTKAKNCLEPTWYDALPSRTIAVSSACNKSGRVQACIRYVSCKSADGSDYIRQALCAPEKCSDVTGKPQSCLEDETAIFIKPDEKYIKGQSTLDDSSDEYKVKTY